MDAMAWLDMPRRAARIEANWRDLEDTFHPGRPESHLASFIARTTRVWI